MLEIYKIRDYNITVVKKSKQKESLNSWGVKVMTAFHVACIILSLIGLVSSIAAMIISRRY